MGVDAGQTPESPVSPAVAAVAPKAACVDVLLQRTCLSPAALDPVARNKVGRTDGVRAALAPAAMPGCISQDLPAVSYSVSHGPKQHDGLLPGEHG